jgi:hypothetical protein
LRAADGVRSPAAHLLKTYPLLRGPARVPVSLTASGAPLLLTGRLHAAQRQLQSLGRWTGLGSPPLESDGALVGCEACHVRPNLALSTP